MAPSFITARTVLLACAVTASQISLSDAADPARIVFQNGSSIPVSAVSLQGDKLVVTGTAEGFAQGQNFPAQSADHVFGEKPAEVSQAVALLLWDKPKDALKLLEPVVAAHKVTAKVPGNFWLEAARAALVGYALTGDTARCQAIGKEIGDATPAQGVDPFVALGKALLMPTTGKAEDRLVALRDLTVGDQPADVSAYATYFSGNLLKDEKRAPEAMEAYLTVTCLFPSGGLILTAAAEIKGAEMLAALSRREEAVALLNSAIRTSGGTVLAEEAKKRLESLK
jgi:fructose-specific component phosphotransferase system IIB-like protein